MYSAPVRGFASTTTGYYLAALPGCFKSRRFYLQIRKQQPMKKMFAGLAPN